MSVLRKNLWLLASCSMFAIAVAAMSVTAPTPIYASSGGCPEGEEDCYGECYDPDEACCCDCGCVEDKPDPSASCEH